MRIKYRAGTESCDYCHVPLKERGICDWCRDKNFESKIKSNCFICGIALKDVSMDRYIIQGNACASCNVRAEDVVKRKITIEQADQDLAIARLNNETKGTNT